MSITRTGLNPASISAFDGVNQEGKLVGTSTDAQQVVDPQWGMADNIASAKANSKEAFFDGLGLIPGVGTAANVARGFWNIGDGIISGNAHTAWDGVKSIGKGALYMIPFVGPMLAGVNLAKNLGDTAVDLGRAGADALGFGGLDTTRSAAARAMMAENLGYSSALMQRDQLLAGQRSSSAYDDFGALTPAALAVGASTLGVGATAMAALSPGLRNIDTSTGKVVGAGSDAQEVRDAATGLVDRGASAKKNAVESFFDAVGMIPVVGGIANALRGIFNVGKGLISGNPNEAWDGLKSIGKGALYAVPGLGTVVAGVNLAKNLGDTVVDGTMAAADQAMYGGFEGKRAMMLQNMGYSAGIAHTHPMAAYGGY